HSLLRQRSTLNYQSLSLHDALPIYAIDGKLARLTNRSSAFGQMLDHGCDAIVLGCIIFMTFGNMDILQSSLFDSSYMYRAMLFLDRKSTRLNSSHRTISYAVFSLKK